MSVSFYIKNKKSLWGQASPMKVKECLELSENEIIQYTFNEAEENFSVDEFYNSFITDYECLLLGQDGVSGRGFEVSFEEQTKEYVVRVFTPSTRADWQVALAYIGDLAKKLGQKEIISERDEHFTPENIHTFDYEDDIFAGIKAIKQDEEEKEFYLFGVNRPVAINDEIYNKIITAENPIDAFSDFFHEIQYLDAYSANQMFYRDNEPQEIFGAYALTQDTPTILPYEPSVEFHYQENLRDEEVTRWQISLVKIDGDPNLNESYDVAGILDYKEFINRLPKDKYRFIDAKYILVEALSQEEILDLVK